MNLVYNFKDKRKARKKARSKDEVSSGESGGFLRAKSEFPRRKVQPPEKALKKGHLSAPQTTVKNVNTTSYLYTWNNFIWPNKYLHI